MIKPFTLSVLLVLYLGCFAQVPQTINSEQDFKALKTEFELLKKENSKLKSEVRSINTKLQKASLRLDSLQHQTKANKDEIVQTSKDLDLKIQSASSQSNDRILVIHRSLSIKTILGIICVLIVLMLSAFVYWLLTKKQQIDKADIIDQLRRTKSTIEENLVKEFGKQTTLIESQIKLLEENNSKLGHLTSSEPDHSLAMKLADEITLIERNVSLMDIKTKGLKQLIASIGKLKDNLAANGYEMPELIGKQFHQGMKVIVVSSIPDENLETGSEIITKIIKPQVNYKDKMIQTAQIEVSVGA